MLKSKDKEIQSLTTTINDRSSLKQKVKTLVFPASVVLWSDLIWEDYRK